MMPSILRSVWHAVKAVVQVTNEAIILLAISTYGCLVSGDTAYEKEKRRRSTKKSYEREKFDQLFDERVLVNRTRIAACDRSRAFYVLNRGRASKAFSRPVDETHCAWPLAGALLPQTNLVLLALFKPCMDAGGPTPPDPMINQKVTTEDEDGPKTVPSAALLACARNVVPLVTRPPRTTCFPHRYEQEEGYRQCGPWLPDEEQPEEDSTNVARDSKLLIWIAFSIRLVF